MKLQIGPEVTWFIETNSRRYTSWISLFFLFNELIGTSYIRYLHQVNSTTNWRDAYRNIPKIHQIYTHENILITC